MKEKTYHIFELLIAYTLGLSVRVLRIDLLPGPAGADRPLLVYVEDENESSAAR